LSKLEGLADSLMRDVHRLAWELRPAALDDFGLELALRRYAEEWAALSGVAVDFDSQGVTSRRLAREVETTLYRIAREALTNVFRHAEAKRVSILLQRRAGHVSLIVEDDGRGFDAAAMLRAPANQGKLGLLGMQERATLGGGSAQIESSPGAGTTVVVRMPLAFEPSTL
jgi:signal transduction histidine kinase